MKQYEPIQYWTKVGRKRIKTRKWFDKQQEEILRTLENLQFDSVLEIGCGDGRITELILKNFDVEKYHAIDISEDRIKRTKDILSKYCQTCSSKLTQSSFQDYQCKEKYDLVIAIEVMMHVPSQDITSFVKKMENLSKKYMLNLDYYPKKGFEWKNQFNRNFYHPYPSLYDNLNLSVYQISMHRIINKQSLFCVIKS